MSAYNFVYEYSCNGLGFHVRNCHILHRFCQNVSENNYIFVARIRHGQYKYINSYFIKRFNEVDYMIQVGTRHRRIFKACTNRISHIIYCFLVGILPKETIFQLYQGFFFTQMQTHKIIMTELKYISFFIASGISNRLYIFLFFPLRNLKRIPTSGT
jgi:hypothetical protein